MTSINQTFIFDQLRVVGAKLKQVFVTLTPLIEREEMIAAFRRIDGEAANAIKSALKSAYPDIGWLKGELKGAEAWQRASKGRYWVCDAIDGAVQYLRAIPQWCTSLTLIIDGQPTFTAILDAMHDELFHAIAGEGAFLNGHPIHVNARNSHVGAVLASSQPPFINKNQQVIRQLGESLSAVLSDAGVVRNLGPTSLQLAYIACGRLDAFWEYGEDTFNCLGGTLLIREAGGHATDVAGEMYRMQSDSVVAASPLVHVSLIKVLANV